jgi:hypothetical protein
VAAAAGAGARPIPEKKKTEIFLSAFFLGRISTKLCQALEFVCFGKQLPLVFTDQT